MRTAFASIYTRLLNELAVYLAQPVKRHTASSTPDPRDLAAVLAHGDVLVTDGNTRIAALVRRVTRSPWSHVAMYVGPLETGPDPRCIVEADIAAGLRAVRLSELKGLRLRVLRRGGLDDTQLLRLPHAWRSAPAPVAMAQSATRFICSTLLAQAFLLIGSPVVRDHSYVTPSDFETASVLEPVRSP